MAEKAEPLFDRETLLDLTVNFVPLAILLLFLILYIVFTPFGFDSVISSIQFAIIGVMFVALAVLTYYSGAAVSRAEKEEETAAALGEGEGEGRDEESPALDAEATGEEGHEPGADRGELDAGEAAADGPVEGEAAAATTAETAESGDEDEDGRGES